MLAHNTPLAAAMQAFQTLRDASRKQITSFRDAEGGLVHVKPTHPRDDHPGRWASPLKPQDWWESDCSDVWFAHREEHLEALRKAMKDAGCVGNWFGAGLAPVRAEIPERQAKRDEKFYQERPVAWRGYADAPEVSKGVRPIYKSLRIAKEAIAEKVGLSDPLAKPRATRPSLRGPSLTV